MQEDSRQPRKWDVFHFASSNFVKLKTDHPNSELEIFFKLCKSYCFNSTAHNRTWQDARRVTFVAEALNFSARWHVMQPDNLLVLFSFCFNLLQIDLAVVRYVSLHVCLWCLNDSRIQISRFKIQLIYHCTLYGDICSIEPDWKKRRSGMIF